MRINDPTRRSYVHPFLSNLCMIAMHIPDVQHSSSRVTDLCTAEHCCRGSTSDSGERVQRVSRLTCSTCPRFMGANRRSSPSTGESCAVRLADQACEPPLCTQFTGHAHYTLIYHPHSTQYLCDVVRFYGHVATGNYSSSCGHSPVDHP